MAALHQQLHEISDIELGNVLQLMVRHDGAQRVQDGDCGGVVHEGHDVVRVLVSPVGRILGHIDQRVYYILEPRGVVHPATVPELQGDGGREYYKPHESSAHLVINSDIFA